MHKALSAAICNQTRVIRNYGQRPDGVTIVSWFSGQNLVWNATVFDTFAPPKCTCILSCGFNSSEKKKLRPGFHMFLHICYWVFGKYAMDFLGKLSHWLTHITQEDPVPTCFKDRMVVIQQGNVLSMFWKQWIHLCYYFSVKGFQDFFTILFLKVVQVLNQHFVKLLFKWLQLKFFKSCASTTCSSTCPRCLIQLEWNKE